MTRRRDKLSADTQRVLDVIEQHPGHSIEVYTEMLRPWSKSKVGGTIGILWWWDYLERQTEPGDWISYRVTTKGQDHAL